MKLWKKWKQLNFRMWLHSMRNVLNVLWTCCLKTQQFQMTTPRPRFALNWTWTSSRQLPPRRTVPMPTVGAARKSNFSKSGDSGKINWQRHRMQRRRQMSTTGTTTSPNRCPHSLRSTFPLLQKIWFFFQLLTSLKISHFSIKQNERREWLGRLRGVCLASESPFPGRDSIDLAYQVKKFRNIPRKARTSVFFHLTFFPCH